jgi:Transporter associated domain/Bacitracin resistance protein BacA
MPAQHLLLPDAKSAFDVMSHCHGLAEAALRGLLQRLTEFLPVSSSAHLRIVGPPQPSGGDPGAAFTAITRIGTEAAVLLYLRRELTAIALSWWRSATSLGKACRRRFAHGLADPGGLVADRAARAASTSWAVQHEDGSWLPDGHVPVPELKDRLHLRSVAEEDRGRYHTPSGMMMLLTGRLPKVADSAHWEGWQLEILDMDGKTIDKVLATRMPEPEAAADHADPARP